jgi:hypothetical protein
MERVLILIGFAIAALWTTSALAYVPYDGGCMSTGCIVAPDSDGDGVSDDFDACPHDAAKYSHPCNDLDRILTCVNENTTMSNMFSSVSMGFAVTVLIYPGFALPASLVSIYLAGHSFLAANRPCGENL